MEEAEEAGGDEEDESGVEGAVPASVVIFTFMPCSQWPAVPQAK